MILTGATCTGKTKYSILLAKKLNTSIINADSLLFYKDLKIATAKPSEKDLNEVKHHLIDFLDHDEKFNAKNYVLKVEKILKKEKSLVVGGSIFYIRALISGPFQENSIEDIRKKFLEKIINKISYDQLIDLLSKVDSFFFEKYSKNDFYRIKRALIFYIINNRPYSQERPTEGLLKDEKIIIFHLPKEKHDFLIKTRVQDMIKEGLIEEAEKIKKLKSPLMNVIGIKEAIDFLDKKTSLKEMTEKIYIRTRQVAKRQRNFLKNLKGMMINPLEQDPIEMIVQQLYKDDPR